MPDSTLPRTLPVAAKLVRDEMSMFQSLAAARRNVLEIIPEPCLRERIVSGRTGKRWHMLTDPQGIRQILIEKLDHYPKSVVTKNLLEPAIGDSMFVAEGAHWRWQRRTAAPVFTHRNISNLGPIMTRAAEASSARIAAQAGQPMNLLDEMVSATFDVISDVTFSGDAAMDRQAVHRAIDEYLQEAGRITLLDVLGAPNWIPRLSRITSGKAMREMKQVANQAIERRAKSPSDDVPDLLDLLLAGQDPDSGRKMSTTELRDNLLTFIIAGHETTALTLAWSLYLLGFDPSVQERAREEAQTVLQGRGAAAEDVPNLPFIRAIIDEALRLYPPGALISRTALRKDTLCGREVLPGDTVMVPIYALHRHEVLWDEPNAFRPDRWTNKPDRFAYLPFADGPRVCIGMSFAVQEAVIILATLLGRFSFEALPDSTPDPVMIITLRPEGGVWLTPTPL